jgi:hypothetical protein
MAFKSKKISADIKQHTEERTMHKADWHLATSLPMRPKPAGSSDAGVTAAVCIM